MIGFGTIRSIFQSCQFIIRNENSIALGWFHRYIFLERCLTSLHAVHSNRFTVSEETIVREEGIYDNTRVRLYDYEEKERGGECTRKEYTDDDPDGEATRRNGSMKLE